MGNFSSVDYFLIGIIAFASSFFGAFGKEFADIVIRRFRRFCRVKSKR